MIPWEDARERGQSMVIVAVMILVLVGFLASVVDIGNVYAQRRFMQNAADAGALAAARALALGGDPVAAAEHYAKDLNGAQVCLTTVVSPSVYVTVSKTSPTYFAAAIGYPSFVVQAAAQARLSGPTSCGDSNLVPVAVYQGAIALNPKKTLIWDSSTTDDGPKDPDDYPYGWVHGYDNLVSGSRRGWLDLNNDGSMSNAELKNWIQYGYHGAPIRVGDWIAGDPGTRSAALQAMDEYRREGEQEIICPVYDDFKDGKFHICGFAVFDVFDVKWKGYFKYMVGQFKRYVAPGEWEGGGPLGPGGLAVINLVH